MQKRFLLVVVVVILPSIFVHAQTTGLDSPVCNAQFAQLLVSQQVMESKSVVEPVKRIKILLRSGDFLWKFDEPTARAYFTEAWKMADDRFKEKGFEKKEPEGKKDGMVIQLPDQRMEVIRAITKRDGEWGKKLSDQILADYDKTAADRTGFDKTREIDELLRLAQQNAKTNPELSRYFFNRLMKYPLTGSWFSALYATAGDNQAIADTIYADALRNYRGESPKRLLYLSAYPFGNERMFGVDRFQMGTSIPAGFAANTALQRQFIDTFFARIAGYAASEEDMNRVVEKNSTPEPIYMVSALREIEPIVIERFPDMLERFGIAQSQASSLLSEEMRKQLGDREKQDSGRGASFEEKLKDAEKADGIGKLTDRMTVDLTVWTKKTDEQFGKAESWLDKLKDANVRRETTNYFWFLRSQLAIDEKRFGDAEKYAQKVPEIEHRAVLMFNVATIQAKNERDIGSLFDTLNRLSKLTHSADNSVAKAQILLGLSNMYEKANHSVALDELGEAIRVTNSLKDPDIFSTNVTRQIWSVSEGFGFFASFGTPGYDLEKTFEELSKKDFEMSLANAKALDDKYFRTLAVIAVATNCAKNAKPVVKPKDKP